MGVAELRPVGSVAEDRGER